MKIKKIIATVAAVLLLEHQLLRLSGQNVGRTMAAESKREI